MIERYSIPIVTEIVIIIELIGVAIVTVGAAWAIVQYFMSIFRSDDRVEAFECLRSNLGRSIILGLEFLVAADIINTVVVDMSLENVASLAAIVAIRVLLSFTLEAEIDGRWPWQRGKRSSG